MKRLLLVATVTLGLAVPAAAAALPGLPSDTGEGPALSVRPAEIIFTGDGSGILGGFGGVGPLHHFGRLRWTSWTASDARGHGAVWIDDCEPNCAAGRYRAHAVRVHAFAPEGNHFTRVTLDYTYEGKATVEHLAVRRFGTVLGYAILG